MLAVLGPPRTRRSGARRSRSRVCGWRSPACRSSGGRAGPFGRGRTPAGSWHSSAAFAPRHRPRRTASREARCRLRRPGAAGRALLRPVLVAGGAAAATRRPSGDSLRGRRAPGPGGGRPRRRPPTAVPCRLRRRYGPAAAGARRAERARPAAPAGRACRRPVVLAAGRLWDEAKNVAQPRRRSRLGSPWPVEVAGEAAPERRRRDAGGLHHLGRLAPAEPARPAWRSAAIFAAARPLRAVRPRHPRGRARGLRAGPGRHRRACASCGTAPRSSSRRTSRGAARGAPGADRRRPAPRERLADARPRAARALRPARMAEGYLGALRATCSPPGASSARDARGRRPRHAGRDVLPLAGLRLEPRQRPLPARRRARAAARAATRSRSYEPRGRLEPRRTCVADHGRRRRSRLARGLSRPARAATLRPGDARTSTARWTGPTWCWSTSGTSPSWSPRSAERRARGRRFTLLFHDTHHRAVTEPEAHRPLRPRRATTACSPSATCCASSTCARGWARRAWTWHEAADTRALPPARRASSAEATWSGSATGATASAPPSCTSSCSSRCRRLGLRGARPRRALPGEALQRAGATPASSYARLAAEPPGAAASSPATASPSTCRAGPTSRRCPASPPSASFEALACGIPLVSAPWDDAEGLFPPGRDFLVAARRRGDARGTCARCCDDAELRRELAATRPRARSARATPARTASTSCSRSTPSSSGPRSPPGGRAACCDRLLRLQPGLRYWNGAATYYRGLVRALARARPPDHLLRARRLRPPAAPRHRRSGLGAVVVYPAHGATAGRRRSSRRGGADLVVKASGVGVFDAELEAAVLELRRPGDLRRRSGTSTRRPRSTASTAIPADPFRAARSRATTSSSPTAAATRWSRAYAALGRPALRPDLQRARPRRPTTRCRPSRASPATSASSATGCPTARRGSRSSSSRAAALCRERALPARRRRLGRQAAARRTCATSATSARADHNAFNCTARAVLNVNRDSMARVRLLARRRGCSRPPAPAPA